VTSHELFCLPSFGLLMVYGLGDPGFFLVKCAVYLLRNGQYPRTLNEPALLDMLF
jgi:hypothetical protein